MHTAAAIGIDGDWHGLPFLVRARHFWHWFMGNFFCMGLFLSFCLYPTPLRAGDPTVGSEIKKTRPCVIISPDEMNRHILTVIIAPMTTKGNDYSKEKRRFSLPLNLRSCIFKLTFGKLFVILYPTVTRDWCPHP